MIRKRIMAQLRYWWWLHHLWLIAVAIVLIGFPIAIWLLPAPAPTQSQSSTPVVIDLSDSGDTIADADLVVLVDVAGQNFKEIAVPRFRAGMQPTPRPIVTPQPTTTPRPIVTPQPTTTPRPIVTPQVL